MYLKVVQEAINIKEFKALQEGFKKLKSDHEELKKKYEAQKFEFEGLLKLLTGSKNERHKPDEFAEQPLLPFAEKEEGKAPPAEKVKVSYERTKKKHPGRTKFPEGIRVKETVIEPEEDTTGMVYIGDEITESIDYTPGKLVKNRIIRRKYARKEKVGKEADRSSRIRDCRNAVNAKGSSSEIVIGKLPDRPLPKAIADAGLLTFLFVAKYVDHMPFYRQIQQFQRNFGWTIHKSTLNDWFVACCTLIHPLYEVLIKEVMNTDYLQIDESPIKVQDSGKKGKTHQGYMWVYREPTTGPVLFEYRKGRGMEGPTERLKGFRGKIQCDGYKVYESLVKKRKDKKLKLISCLAHIRRKFFDAKGHHPELAKHALKVIRSLYMLERTYREENLDPEQIASRRQKEAAPILNELIEWVNEKQAMHLTKGPIGKALLYAKGQLPKLKPYLKDGRIQIDNNLIENAIRPLALGRKNYLFAGSHRAAQRAAMMYSFFATCKTMDINPFNWLKDTLEKIPSTKITQLKTLLPHNYNREDSNM